MHDDDSTRNGQNGLTRKQPAAALHALCALTLSLGALACAGSHDKPGATPATDPEYDKQADYEANPPAERTTSDQPVTKPGVTDRQAAVEQQTRVGDRQAGTDTTPSETRARSDVRSDADATPKRADDTGKNERDRNSATLTPGDQSEATSDVELTARIRRAVVGDDALSFDAKNVKIITSDGRVTLRGTVDSAAEKTKIETHARQAAGAGKVTNQLEIQH